LDIISSDKFQGLTTASNLSASAVEGSDQALVPSSETEFIPVTNNSSSNFFPML
jgi:hypothetical protein